MDREALLSQQFGNEYQLVNGVQMHRENPEHFYVPPLVIKRHIRVGHFVELRIDSPRFSMHDDDAEQCACPSCSGQMKKPVLRHEHPASLVEVPIQEIPARGWGEDFWVKTTQRSGDYFQGMIDNRLVESRLHGLQQGDLVVFHLDHILAVHPIHRQELVLGMSSTDLKELADWLSS